jgi:hypothetical protein
MEAWIGIAGTVVAALLAFVFGRVNLARASDHERSEALRRQRLEVFGGFCAAIVQYRRAQLHRWFEGSQNGAPNPTKQISPEVDDEVRASRADAWAAYYQMLMLTEDRKLTDDARHVLALTKAMKDSKSADEVNLKSDEVHAAVDGFARKCLPQVASVR